MLCRYLNPDYAIESYKIAFMLVLWVFAKNLHPKGISDGQVNPKGMENFFRKGGIDDYKNVLSTKSIDLIIENHGDMMQKLGYLDH